MNGFHFRQKENPQKTHAEEKLDRIGVMVRIFQKRTGKIGVTLETFPRTLFQLVLQIGVFYILITDVNKYRRIGKVNMYKVCKETADCGKW
jgi:hypothetical protein